MLRRLVPGVDETVARAAERVEVSANSCFTVHAALNQPLRFKAGPHANQAYFTELMPASMNVLRQYFDALRYGRMPDTSLLGLTSPSTFDTTRCPPGKATLHVWDYVPYAHPDGGPQHWDQAKDAFAQTMLSRMQPFIDNLTPENIIQYVADSPLDIERSSPSFQKGDVHGAAPYIYQSGAHRPTPDLGRNTVPGVERLYLVGTVPTPRRRSIRRGPRDGHEDVRRHENRFRQDWPQAMMKIYGQDNSELMQVTLLERDGNVLVIKGKVFASMPMTAKLTPQEARNALKLLNFKLVAFLLTFLFRR